MNRLIIIGNGFDLAHGLKTSYTDFINNYWQEINSQLFKNIQENKMSSNVLFEDEFILIKLITLSMKDINEMESYQTHQDEERKINDTAYNKFIKSFNLLCENIPQSSRNVNTHIEVHFKNQFFEKLNKKLNLQNWVDIEEEYYRCLIDTSHIQSFEERGTKIKRMNLEFGQIKNHLETYLDKAIQSTNKEKYKPHNSILNAITSNLKETISAKDLFDRHQVLMPVNIQHKPEQTVILNFNYTNTYKNLYYSSYIDELIINIHGSLNDKDNPIIFGYGDEMDKSYKEIEDLGDNDFLTNIKSMNYLMSDNYDKLMKFITSDDYQVMIMGHSCGNSDRLLLNSIFENPHCKNIQVYYHQYEYNGELIDDYKDKIMNIHRIFKNKKDMRSRVVNYKDSSPLVPFNK